ncbi:MAG: polysaccharide deacetylase family protein [Bacteroidota bacterium]
MKKLLIAVLLVYTSASGFSQNKKICVTVDDLPVVTYGKTDHQLRLTITKRLIATFKQYDIPAIGYVNESKLYANGEFKQERLDLLEMWLAGGNDLGNHTFSHPSYHKADFTTFTKDIIKGEQLTKPLVEKYGKALKYFRHPYLRVGLTKEKHQALTQFLTEHGYTEAPVTIDNEDYLFAKAYHLAYNKRDEATMSKIGEDYVTYMEDKLIFYENMSIKLFERPMAQSLLIHASLLNADYMDDLAEIYKKHGYTFVSQEDVLKDEAYNSEITRYGDWGISWLDRWALSQGKKGAFFAGDIPTPNYVKELAR